MSNIVKYKNGNYSVLLDPDNGTKIRYNNKDELIPEFPESMDLCISKKCLQGCQFCHEKCTPNGGHADLMNLEFIDNLHPYTELALNGNDPIHPELIPFLEKCKKLKLIPSLTVNHYTFNKNIEFLKYLCDKKLIYGLGVSIDGIYDDDFEIVNGMISKFKMFPNLVLHVINGILPAEDLKLLAHHGLKVLILGYKQFGRGIDFFGYNGLNVLCNQNDLYNMLPEIVKDEWFDVISFDNLGIEQLKPQRLMNDDEWNKMFMGNDGQYTMYVDCVNKQFAKNSTSDERYDLMDNITDMFNMIRVENQMQILYDFYVTVQSGVFRVQ